MMALVRKVVPWVSHVLHRLISGKHETIFFPETTSLMPLLPLPYDEYTMPVRCPNYRFRAASAGRPCDHSTDLRASWPLRFCLTPHNDKFEKSRKPVARRHIAVTSYNPRTGVARFCLFVLLLYVPSQQLWSLRDGQFT